MILIVKVTDIEGLYKEYLEKGDIKRADALYLYFKRGPEGAAQTLRIRYGIAAPLTSVIEDLKALGITNRSGKTEDSQEYFTKVFKVSFEKLCLDRIIELAEEKMKGTSPLAREILFLITALGDDALNFNLCSKVYKLLFQRALDNKSYERALEELVTCYVLEVSTYGYSLTDFFDTLLLRLSQFLPEVEVRVTWPKEV